MEVAPRLSSADRLRLRPNVLFSLIIQQYAFECRSDVQEGSNEAAGVIRPHIRRAKAIVLTEFRQEATITTTYRPIRRPIRIRPSWKRTIT